MRGIMIKFIIIIVSCQIHGITSDLLIERQRGSQFGSTEFYHTEDSFTNPTNKFAFCKARNSETKGYNNDKCTCKSQQDSFVSYKYGCLNFEQAKKVLGGSHCWKPTASSVDTIVQSNFGSSYCVDFEYNTYFSNCIVRNTMVYNPITSEYTKLENIHYKIIFKKSSDNSSPYSYCFQCERTNCDLSSWTGRIVKLMFDCVGEKLEEIDHCILFQRKGNHNIKLDTIPTITKQNNQDGMIGVERSKHHSTDLFANLHEDHTEDFCLQLGGHCGKALSQCPTCECPEHDTFLSYKTGCFNVSMANGALSGKTSLMTLGTNPSRIATVNTDFFMYGTCSRLHTNEIFVSGGIKDPSAWNCIATTFSSFHPLTGEERIHQENPFVLSKEQFHTPPLCLKCESFTCDLSRFTGLITKVNIKCRYNINGTYKKPADITSAILLKFGGKSYSDGQFGSKVNDVEPRNYAFDQPNLIDVQINICSVTSLLPTEEGKVNTRKTGKTDSSSIGKSTIIVIVLCLLLFVGFIIFIVIFIRRRKAKKKQTQCAHYTNDEHKNNPHQIPKKDNLYEENTQYQQLDTSSADERTAENIYYQTSDSIGIGPNPVTGGGSYEVNLTNPSRSNGSGPSNSTGPSVGGPSSGVGSYEINLISSDMPGDDNNDTDQTAAGTNDPENLYEVNFNNTVRDDEKNDVDANPIYEPQEPQYHVLEGNGQQQVVSGDYDYAYSHFDKNKKAKPMPLTDAGGGSKSNVSAGNGSN